MAAAVRFYTLVGKVKIFPAYNRFQQSLRFPFTIVLSALGHRRVAQRSRITSGFHPCFLRVALISHEVVCCHRFPYESFELSEPLMFGPSPVERDTMASADF